MNALKFCFDFNMVSFSDKTSTVEFDCVKIPSKKNENVCYKANDIVQVNILKMNIVDDVVQVNTLKKHC